LAKDIFINEGLNMALIGRSKNGEEFQEIFKFK